MEYAKLSRRSLLALTAATGVTVAADAAVSAASPTPTDPWHRLVAGNNRFATGRPHHPSQDPTHRETLVEAQHPFACILGCADSRVPAELLFDQGLGDLFTVRATPWDPDETRYLAACVRNQTTRIATELTTRSHAIRMAAAAA
jgi:carbonic anhydrase